MSRLGDAARSVWQVALATPGLRVLLMAIRNYILHQSANQAGSLAFSSVLAMFPLLILVSAAAGFFGQPGDAAALADRVMSYAPQTVRDALQPVINQVLAQRNQALLAIGVIATLWTASSGLQAVRTALNRAYGIDRGLPFWKARLKVTLFTVIVGTGILIAFSSVIVMPLLWQLLESNVGAGPEALWLRNSVRYGLAFLTLAILYAVLYGWLPDIRQRLNTVLPGAIVGAMLWVGAAATLSYTLRSAGKLALVYGSFAGVVATLVFLYISATTLIFGAEINSVLHEQPVPPARPPAPPKASAERAFALMGQQAPDFAFVLQDHAGAIIGWRAAAEGIFGYSEDEVLGRPIDFLFTDEDRALGLPDLERDVARSTGRSEDDRWHVRKDGTQIWVCGSLIALREEGQHVGYAKVMCDRTNLRAQLATLGHRLASANEALQKRDVFFSRLTHELRNALAPIGHASRLIEHKGPHEEAAAPMAVVMRQVGLMSRMMNDLAEVVRSGAGKLQLNKQTFNLADDLLAIAAVVRPDSRRKAQTLELNLPKEPIRILADKDRVHQIVFNLLHNAIKYTPEGGRIWLHCSVEVDEAVIKVEDTGVGIAPALLPEIFDLFTQENPHQSEGGFGVGLSLVKDLVDAHHGFVEVRSEGKNRGSEFTVRLPLGLER